MNKTVILANRLSEVLLSGRWIANTNFREQIESTTWEQATQKIQNLNTIADLTFHINYYLQGILDAFATSKLEIQDKFSFDTPPITSAEDWENLVQQFIKNANTFVASIGILEDEALKKPFFDERYGTHERNIEGVIEHSYYHLGQVSLIKKLLTK
jgi:uncharacterized damage-inducible protein DinB